MELDQIDDRGLLPVRDEVVALGPLAGRIVQLDHRDQLVLSGVRDQRMERGRIGRDTVLRDSPYYPDRIGAALADLGEGNRSNGVTAVIHRHLVHAAQNDTLTQRVSQLPAVNIESGLVPPNRRAVGPMCCDQLDQPTWNELDQTGEPWGQVFFDPPAQPILKERGQRGEALPGLGRNISHLLRGFVRRRDTAQASDGS